MYFQQTGGSWKLFLLTLQDMGNIEINLNPYSRMPKCSPVIIHSASSVSSTVFLGPYYRLRGHMIQWHSHKCDSNCHSPSCELLSIATQLVHLRVIIQYFCSYLPTELLEHLTSLQSLIVNTPAWLESIIHLIIKVMCRVLSHSHLNIHDTNFKLQGPKSVFTAQ